MECLPQHMPITRKHMLCQCFQQMTWEYAFLFQGQKLHSSISYSKNSMYSREKLCRSPTPVLLQHTSL